MILRKLSSGVTSPVLPMDSYMCHPSPHFQNHSYSLVLAISEENSVVVLSPPHSL